nr:chromosome segregation protein SMC [Aliidiomarina sedimenti]
MMRLNYIKLAGFKSFVDSTKVPFPEQMTCVVGPNGCGKSNVIDAVRWVLGESSAKNLRGDAMTDVIFNGSNSRKPVSRASVELVFDNSEGRLQGEYASYQEISVKRLVTRDGQSSYFLNGSKCRRRDITDLFLGTGLGPRSYAIIEQGMISRLIESRPQELRVFIEEAAGISKYKERRKDSESRMRRTRENLERLTDVRDELGTQLAKLQRQAAAAQRYKTLKAEERTLKAQLQALRWLHYQQQCDRVEAQLRDEQTELERWIAEQRGSERGQTELRERQAQLKADFDKAQQAFYQCNNDITRMEQSIQHQRQLADQRRRDLDEATLQLEQLRSQLDEESAEAELIAETLLQLEPEFELKQAELEESSERLLELEEALQNQQQEADALAQRMRDKNQRIQVAQTELAGMESLQQRLDVQYQQAQTRLAQLQQQNLQAEQTQLSATLSESEQQLAEAEQTHQAAKQHSLQQATELEALSVEVHQLNSQRQQVSGRIASFEQLLASAEPAQQPALDSWLQGQAHAPSLLQLLEVDTRWQSAVEAVAGALLHAPVLRQAEFETLLQAPLTQGGLLHLHKIAQPPPAKSLATRLTGDAAHLHLFRNVALVADGEEAAELFGQQSYLMAVDQAGRLYTPDGIQQPTDSADSVLAWQQNLQQWQADHAQLEQQSSALEQRQRELREKKQRSETELERVAEQLRNRQQQVLEQRTELQSLQQRLEQQQQERDELEQSVEELSLTLAEQEERKLALEDELDSLRIEVSDQEPAEQLQQQQLSQARQQLQAVRDQQQVVQQDVHQLQLKQQQAQQSQAHLQRSMQRSSSNEEALRERIAGLQGQQQDQDTTEQQEELAEALARREDAEAEKQAFAEALAEVDAELNVLNSGQQGVQQKIEQQREQVEASKLELAASRERGHSLLEGLQETGYALKEILEAMPEDADEGEWQQRLDKIARSLQQLGAINLAAIEEAEAQAERKAYLDSQYDDLNESLALLEDAIKKIDKETRQRFRKTFDQVNSDLSQLFPKVFGGGSAYLALTDDDLLETGVTIMARPPGKKNSTIHLLSGGEKALTALSLVFAIFRLNPAPFCMLDEVDAPLDDANVGRFCRLVQEMSESVQFIYISHNKIAMEMATHLAGVTMQEPGVSRLVAVDVDEAVALADAS